MILLSFFFTFENSKLDKTFSVLKIFDVLYVISKMPKKIVSDHFFIQKTFLSSLSSKIQTARKKWPKFNIYSGCHFCLDKTFCMNTLLLF